MDGLSDPVIAGIRRSAAAADLPPQTLPERIGSYVLLGEIGRGGMGVVYRAHHEHLRRDVALKMLLAGPSADRGERIRFRAEAEAVARLQHPHIVQIFEVGEYDNGVGGSRPYVALEYVDGVNLAVRLSGRPQPPPDRPRPGSNPWAAPSITPTRRASSTATSSRPTCC